MPVSTVTSKGQITVPKAIRERLGIKEGDKIEFCPDEQGRIVVRLCRRGLGISGILSDFAPDEPVTLRAMNQAIRRRAAEKAECASR